MAQTLTSRALIALMLALFLLPDLAAAHGAPVSLAFWGGYPRGVARCQRAIARASARCMSDVIAARQACLTPGLQGTACDTQQLTTTIESLRQRALAMVGPKCTSIQLQQLLYADLSDAYRDIIDACRRLDTAMTSAVYAPALRGGTVTAIDDAPRACVESTAAASAKLFALSIRARQRAFDRIAGSQLAPSEKQALVDRSGEQITNVIAELHAQISARCPSQGFANLYGRLLEAYLTGISAQAGCHSQYVYVQNAVLCPVIACGNGIQEPGEQCDDGNDFDADGCAATCTRTECTICAP